MITEKTYRALDILNEREWDKPITARDFALKMWPDGKWKKMYNVGNGATSGVGMWLSAGSYLSKLKKRGLVWDEYDQQDGYQRFWHISSKGKEAIEEYEKANKIKAEKT